jgi:hypothetical protein
VLSLLFGSALAADLLVVGEVSPDLHVVSALVGPAGPGPVHAPLPLPDRPTDDIGIQREGPGWPDAGEMRTTPDPAGLRVTATLPRRYGDTAALRREGLWSNGTWLPAQPAPVSWVASVSLPPDTVGVLNGAVREAGAAGPLTWSGVADRLALAVLPARRAPISRAEVAGGGITFVGRAAQRPNVQRQVVALVEQGWPLPDPPRLVVVTDHDRKRLATAGPGVVYLSDRAFRLSPGLSRFHWPAVRRALYAAALGDLPSWDAAFLATLCAEGRPAPSVDRALGWAAWNPIIDELLTDGTLPFYGDNFNEARPSPPDALLALAGARPPREAALQLRDRLGADAAATFVTEALARRGAAGGPVRAAAAALGVDRGMVSGWDTPADPEQDYRIETEGGRPARVARAGGGASEAVVVEVDGEPRVWVAPPGPAEFELPHGTRTAAVDPAAHAVDAARDNNRGPPRWLTVATGWATDLSPSQGSFTAWGDLAFRKQGDTRNVYLAGLRHDPQDLLSLSFGYVRAFGPLVDRRVRQHRVFVSAGPSLLDERFQSTEAGAWVLGGAVGYGFDSRAADTYAMSGRRVAAAFGGGTRIASDERWASVGTSWVELVPIHPRHVIATRLRAGWASGEVEHRLLSLGGADGVRSVDERAVLGNERVVASAEYRWSVVRDASVPLPFAWLSEVQLVPGADAGAVQVDGAPGPTTAAGATIGGYGVFDVVGARPTLVGLVLAFPIYPTVSSVPQAYFSFDHAF